MTSQIRVDSIVPTTGVPTGGGGGIVQVVQVTKTDDFQTSTNANGGVAVPGLSVSITPRSSSNKILVMAGMTLQGTEGYNNGMSIYRGSTLIGVGDRTSDSTTPLQQRVSAYGYAYSGGAYLTTMPTSVTFLDTPSTTSSTTYSVRIHNDGRSSAVTVGNASTDNVSYVMKPISYLILMEVSG